MPPSGLVYLVLIFGYVHNHYMVCVYAGYLLRKARNNIYVVLKAVFRLLPGYYAPLARCKLCVVCVGVLCRYCAIVAVIKGL